MQARSTAVNTPMSPGIRRLLNAALYAMALILPLVWAFENISFYNVPGNLLDPFTDANTYLAAGERLNAGHLLYQLQPGDRFVLMIPGIFDRRCCRRRRSRSIWRPLAAIPFGYTLWIAACWAALFGTIVFLLRRIGPWAAVAVIVLSFSLGEQLAVANINAFAPAFFLLAWRFQHRAIAGFLMGSLTVIKLAPGAMLGWLAGSRRWVACIAFVATFGALVRRRRSGSRIRQLPPVPRNTRNRPADRLEHRGPLRQRRDVCLPRGRLRCLRSCSRSEASIERRSSWR